MIPELIFKTFKDAMTPASFTHNETLKIKGYESNTSFLFHRANS